MNALLETDNIWTAIGILTNAHGMKVGQHLETLLCKEIQGHRKMDLELVAKDIQKQIKRCIGE
jgi:hypothetical protein